MLIKVHKFVHSVDFIVLDIEEDTTIPLILGRPFLYTARALIDIYEKTLVLRLEDEQVKINVFKSNKQPIQNNQCF